MDDKTAEGYRQMARDEHPEVVVVNGGAVMPASTANPVFFPGNRDGAWVQGWVFVAATPVDERKK